MLPVLSKSHRASHPCPCEQPPSRDSSCCRQLYQKQHTRADLPRPLFYLGPCFWCHTCFPLTLQGWLLPHPSFHSQVLALGEQASLPASVTLQY